jgi:hypothetical protein
MEKLRRKAGDRHLVTKSPSVTSVDEQHSVTPKFDEVANETMSLKMKKIGQSAFSTLFGKSQVEGKDASRQMESKSLSEAPSVRAVKRMPSLVNGVVVMAAIPAKIHNNADRWSPCSGSDAEGDQGGSDECSRSTGDGSRDCESVVSEQNKVMY